MKTSEKAMSGLDHGRVKKCKHGAKPEEHCSGCDNVEVKKVEHTPGPWELVGDESNDFSGGRVVANDLRVDICEIAGFMPRYESERLANARLIAAAPELLAALRELQKAVRDAHLLDVKKHYSLCVADAAAGKAIYKATLDK